MQQPVDRQVQASAQGESLEATRSCTFVSTIVKETPAWFMCRTFRTGQDVRPAFVTWLALGCEGLR